jgi:hypothetical protein
MPEEEWWPYTKERGSLDTVAELYRRRFRLLQARGTLECACQLFLSPALWLWASANAAPAVPDLGVTAGSTNIVEAAFGCGRGFHPNHWGRCVPNRWSYNRGWNDRYYGGGWNDRYYGGGYERPWRHRYHYGY